MAFQENGQIGHHFTAEHAQQGCRELGQSQRGLHYLPTPCSSVPKVSPEISAYETLITEALRNASLAFKSLSKKKFILSL